jgi:hypothetical protein
MGASAHARLAFGGNISSREEASPLLPGAFETSD